jgi:hypothetical protein
MVIIIEGLDKCGKTFLSNYIVENYEFRYLKCNQPKKGGPYKEYRKIIDGISKEPGDYVIDRMHLGEFVYGPIYRGKSGLTQEDFKDLENRLIELGTILIYCYDIENNIAKRFKEEKEEFADVKKIKKMLEFYNKILKETKLPVYKHKMKGTMDLIKSGEINKIIKKWKIVFNV